MDQEQLEEQLATVQEMVLEMKQGFTTVMDSLGKIQFGDQSLQKQMAENDSFCQVQIKQMTDSVNSLKVEVQTLSTELASVSSSQKLLEERLELYQIDRDGLLLELERCGAITEHMRAHYQGTGKQIPPLDPSPSFPSTISPMVQPYLASLQQHRDDSCQSESSVTALACKSLSLSQALHDRCLHLDLSASSDDDEIRHTRVCNNDDEVRYTRNAGYHNMMSNTYYSERGIGQKIPPHEKIRENVQRERAAEKIVESEQNYCSTLWSLIDGIMNPLRQEEIMSIKDLDLIFPSYISQLYEQHCIMLHKLEERLSKYKSSGIIGDVFAKLADTCDGDGLTLYKKYIGDFPTIVGNMNKWFSQSTKFRDIMKANNLSTCPVLPLLQAPLQQIPHYTLLIKELLKYTSEDHPDRYYLESSLSKLKNFVVIMNDELDHAMQLLSIKNINRTRENGGTSLRSRSSGSSCDANQTSSARDSGIVSNGEDNGNRMLASPNVAHKYLLQVAGKDYEQPSYPINRSLQIPNNHSQAFDKTSNHMDHSLPIIGNDRAGFNKHPGLLGQLPEREFVNSHSISRLQNSLTAIPQYSRHEVDRPVKQIKFRQRPVSQVLGNKLATHRSLTPSSFALNSTPDSRNMYDNHFNSASGLHRPRPASAIGFGQSEQRDKWADQIVQNIGLSPRLDFRGVSKQGHSIGLSPRLSGGRREDLHRSLQKLLEERDRLEFGIGGEDYIEENPEDIDSSLAVGSSANIVRMQMSSNSGVSHGGKIDNSNVSEDYGVYGDDDDVANSVDMMYNGVKQNEDLSVNHNVSSSTSSGIHPLHEGNESCTQEELAISLAHSLSGGSTKFSNSSGQHSDIDTSNSLPYKLKTLSNSMVHVVNTEPVQNGLNNGNKNSVHERQAGSPQNDWKQIDPNQTSSSDSVTSDSIHADENRSPPPYQPNLRASETIQHEQAEHLTELHDNRKVNLKPIIRKQASEKVSTRSARLAQPHNRALSAKKITVGETEKHKVNPDRNSNLSPSRLPRPLSPPRSRENTPLNPQPVKTGKSQAETASGTTNNRRDLSKECSISKYNPKESKIPHRRMNDTKEPAEPISKSSEDLTKMRKKSAFKHSIKHFFGKKRKSAKVAEFSSSVDLSTNNHFFDPDFAVFSLEEQLDWHGNRKMSASNILLTDAHVTDCTTPCSPV